jgi:hypothetical protein
VAVEDNPMSEQVIAGLFGAVIGASVAGVIAWRLQVIQLRHKEYWDYATLIAEYLGALLSPFTPDMRRSKEELREFRGELYEKLRKFHLLGFGRGTSDPLGTIVNDYIALLESYWDDKIQRGELEQHRAIAKDRAREILLSRNRKWWAIPFRKLNARRRKV